MGEDKGHAESKFEVEDGHGEEKDVPPAPEKEKVATPSEDKKNAAPVKAISFFQLFKYADTLDYTLMFVGSIGSIVNGCSLPIFFLFFGKLLNSIGSIRDDPKRLEDKVATYSLYFVYLAIVAFFCSYVEVAFWMQTGERQSSRIRALYLRAILRQDMAYFDTSTSTGEVVERVSNDTLTLQAGMGEKVGNYLEKMAAFFCGFAVAFSQIWQLTLLILAFLPMLVIPGLLYARALTGIASKATQTYADAGRIAERTIAAIRTVYSFSGEAKAVAAYDVCLEKSRKLGYRAGFAKGLSIGANGLIFVLWAIMIWVGSLLVAKGKASGGEILSTAFCVIIGGISLGQAVPNLKYLAEARIAGYSIFAMIERVPAIDSDDPKGKKLEKVRGTIDLKDVFFTYPARLDAPIFQGLSLTIAAGSKVALVGPSGSGKSTIIQLLERFYDPDSGSVSVDGTNIKELNLRWFRQQVGLVSQEPALFQTTIKKNILYGKEGATDEEVIAAATAANAHSFISQLQDGYDTQVGERGIQMSGGQKQRIAIARAILKKPSILLLDEATSALDAESERVVQDALDRAAEGRTTVIVAHRLSTIRNADLIAALQGGKLMEQGTHDQLVAQDGLYASLVKMQIMQPTVEVPSATATGVPLSSMSGLSDSNNRKSTDRRIELQQSALSADGSAAGAEDAADAGPKPSFWRLVWFNRPEWPLMLGGCLFAVAAGCVNPMWAFVVSQVTGLYYLADVDEMKRRVVVFVWVFLGMGVGSLLSNCGNHFLFGIIGENLTKRIRIMMLKSYLSQEVGYFDQDENSSGAVASRLSSDASLVRALVGDRVSLIVQAGSAIACSFIVGLIIEWRLALVMLSTLPLTILGFFFQNLALKGFSAQIAKEQEGASQVASEAVSQQRTVAAFSAEDKVLGLFNEKLAGTIKKSFKRGLVAGIGLGYSQFILYTTWGLAMWYSGQLTKDGKASFTDILKVFLVIVSAGFGIAEASALAPDFAAGGRAVGAVFTILDRKPQFDPDDPKGKTLDKLEGDIELRHVRFAYPARPDIIVFNDFNLNVRAGTTVALVGQSGSGKSTVIGLVERFYQPLSGQVLVDGVDIQTLQVRWLRSQVGLVSQEPVLLGATILDNILYGRENASRAEVEQAATTANAHSFISGLPSGYDTRVGDGSALLSGGQKQRIAIARAVLKNPRVLLLDEATSALDAESERVVQEALDRLMANRTTIVVAHRLSTVRHANTIAVIQKGEVVEQGSHDKLLAKGENSAYFQLVRLQAGGAT